MRLSRLLPISRRARRLRGRVGLLLLLPLLAMACSPAGKEPVAAAAEPDAEAPADERVPVAAVPLGRGRIESVLRYSTHLEAEDEVAVYAEASRRVVEMRVEEGDRVRKGDVLLRLESDEQENALAKLRSQLEKAERELERQKSLFEQELISEQAFNDASYEKDQLDLAYADGLRELAYTEVRAPISGVIEQRLVGLGDYVRENEHLFDLIDFDSIVARIYVPERELVRLRVGQEARLSSPALGGKIRPAEIARIAPTVDDATGTVKVTLTTPQLEGLLPGMYVEVELVAAVLDDAVLVPKRALVYDRDQTYVYRIDGAGRAHRLRVETQIEDRDFVQVGDRLAEGDRIVVAGQAGLKEGVEVRQLDLEEALATFADEIPNP